MESTRNILVLAILACWIMILLVPGASYSTSATDAWESSVMAVSESDPVRGLSYPDNRNPAQSVRKGASCEALAVSKSPLLDALFHDLCELLTMCYTVLQ